MMVKHRCVDSVSDVQCENGMEYAAEASACPATCTDLDAPANCADQTMTAGCKCNTGYVLSGGQCVKQKYCGCVDKHGNYRKVGTLRCLPLKGLRGLVNIKNIYKSKKSLDTIHPTHPPLYSKKKNSGKSQK